MLGENQPPLRHFNVFSSSAASLPRGAWTAQAHRPNRVWQTSLPPNGQPDEWKFDLPNLKPGISFGTGRRGNRPMRKEI
jgi:hypothetical protein